MGPGDWPCREAASCPGAAGSPRRGRAVRQSGGGQQATGPGSWGCGGGQGPWSPQPEAGPRCEPSGAARGPGLAPGRGTDRFVTCNRAHALQSARPCPFVEEETILLASALWGTAQSLSLGVTQPDVPPPAPRSSRCSEPPQALHFPAWPSPRHPRLCSLRPGEPMTTQALGLAGPAGTSPAPEPQLLSRSRQVTGSVAETQFPDQLGRASWIPHPQHRQLPPRQSARGRRQGPSEEH